MKNKQNNIIQSTSSFNRRRGSINIPTYIELDPEEEYDNNRINSNSNNGEDEDDGGYVSSIADDNAFVSNNPTHQTNSQYNDDYDGDDQQHVDYYDLRTNYNPPLEQQQHYDNDDIYMDAPQNEDELDYNLQQQQYGYNTQYNNGYAAHESRRNLYNNEDEYEEFEDDHRRQLMYQYQQQQLFGAQRNLYIQDDDDDDDDESFHTASSGDSSSESTYRRKRRYTGWLLLLCISIVILISIIIWQITPSNDDDIINGRDELNDMQSPPAARYPTKPQLLIPGIPSSAIPSVSYTPTTLSPTTTYPSTNPTKTLIPSSSPTYVPSMSPVNGIITCICDYDTGKLLYDIIFINY